MIKKINHTSRESFEKTFYEIRENFQMMFRKLFGGGKARSHDVSNLLKFQPAEEPQSQRLGLRRAKVGQQTMQRRCLLFLLQVRQCRALVHAAPWRRLRLVIGTVRADPRQLERLSVRAGAGLALTRCRTNLRCTQEGNGFAQINAACTALAQANLIQSDYGEAQTL